MSSEIYIAYHKPKGIVCTTEKVEGNIIDALNFSEDLLPVGRLDKDSEGLILLTNNKSIINKIIHPDFEHEKEYEVTVNLPLRNQFLKEVALGVDIATNVALNTDHNPHNDHLRTDLFWGVQEANRLNEFEAADLSELHQSWSNSTIRKTTLEPAYSMKGKVFFPQEPKACYIELFMPVDDQYVKILFLQKLIPVNK